MKFLAATLTLLVSSAAAAQECKTCSMADACIKTYLKAASEAQTATKQAIRDWKQNLDRKASCAYRKSNPDIFVMQSAEDWAAKNTPCPFYGAR
jgi:hypothetical protein